MEEACVLGLNENYSESPQADRLHLLREYHRPFSSDINMHPLEQEVLKSRKMQKRTAIVCQGSEYSPISCLLQPISEAQIATPQMTQMRNEMTDIPELIDPAEIPLTVQNCVEINTPNCNKSDDDEEEEITEPTLDWEPDPETESQTTQTKEKNSQGKENTCHLCSKVFCHKKNLYAHIRKIHSSQPTVTGGLICPLCAMHFLRQQHLRDHFLTLHELRVEKEVKHFATLDDFEQWKSQVERDTNSYFISKCAGRPLAVNQVKKYYKCHRSGQVEGGGNPGSISRCKRKSNQKIGATCPAAMETTENVDGIFVTFWSTHIGHDQDPPKKRRNTNLTASKASENPKKEGEEHSLLVFPSLEAELPSSTLLNSLPTNETAKTSRKCVVTQEELISRAENLVELLETTKVQLESRSVVRNMIDNLCSVVQRRAATTRKGVSEKQVRRNRSAKTTKKTKGKD